CGNNNIAPPPALEHRGISHQAHLLNPRDKRRNEPAFLPYVAQSIAHFKKISVKEVAETTTKNAKTLFSMIND
ncbi:MAG: TatD family hydrolase, partial [Capnocytophaga granulosa]